MRPQAWTVMVAVLAAWAQGGAAATASAPAKAAESRPAGGVWVVVLDFVAADEGSTDAVELADSLRLRLARHQDWQVIDALTTREAFSPSPTAPDAQQVQAVMERLAANVALWGTVERRGQSWSVQVRCLDLRDPSAPQTWTRTFTDDTERARGEISRRIVEAVRGEMEWAPPEAGREVEPPNFGKPLNVNGGFEQGSRGWEVPDGVSTFIVEDPSGRGKVLKIRTDLARQPWLDYRRRLLFGQADPNRPPQIPTDTGYSSVAGAEGVHFCSDWIAAQKGRRYWLTADVKCARTGGAFPKIFVKGFADFSASADGLPERSLVERGLTPETFAAVPAAQRKELIAADARSHPERYRREVYRWYLACRNEGGDWTHVAQAFPPRGGLPARVQWLQIQIYAYWPPGEYLFDNVFLYADPSLRTPAGARQTAPLSEEPPRTPSSSLPADPARLSPKGPEYGKTGLP